MDTDSPNSPAERSQDARERILADLRALATDGEALIRATADIAGDKASEARARLTAAVEKAKSTYDELQAQGIHSIKAAATRADQTVRTHPYESLGVAFVIGLLMGALLRRNRS